MENLFRPGKWLVLFCGVFVLLWAVLQFVSNARLKEEAELTGQNLFTWSWPGDNWQSEAKITDTSVVHKGDNDAVVRVSGKQIVKHFPLAAQAKLVTGPVPMNGAKPSTDWVYEGQPDETETIDCSALLTFYKMSEKNKDYWVLGKVEFPK